MRLVISMSLDNSAMQEDGAIAATLTKLATRIDVSVCESQIEAFKGVSGIVRDINGNSIGTWKVSK